MELNHIRRTVKLDGSIVDVHAAASNTSFVGIEYDKEGEIVDAYPVVQEVTETDLAGLMLGEIPADDFARFVDGRAVGDKLIRIGKYATNSEVVVTIDGEHRLAVLYVGEHSSSAHVCEIERGERVAYVRAGA